MRYTVVIEEKYTEWFKEGTKTRHREDGPAVEWRSGNKEWWVNGKLHREDGPAVEYGGYKEWYLNDKQLSEKEFNDRTEPSRDGVVVNIDGKKYKLIEI